MGHIELRNTVKWGSYGRHGGEPLTYRLIKDISNDHLDNIITFIKNHPHSYNSLTGDEISSSLKMMVDEKSYRFDNAIFVPDYTKPSERKTFLRQLHK